MSQSYLPVCSMYTHVHRVAAGGAATIRMDILALSGLFLRYSAGSSIMCSICQSAPARTRTCMKAVQKPGGVSFCCTFLFS
ncbi:hypothetical protein [Methanogenium cariaci]|uniref:hypothetical protein n=1 Tax=Methanogenium cariaci TaxID=2197 RepID=UPI0012F6DBED|nr:hypothetical protein [Methanogenium cariaci]